MENFEEKYNELKIRVECFLRKNPDLLQKWQQNEAEISQAKIIQQAMMKMI